MRRGCIENLGQVTSRVFYVFFPISKIGQNIQTISYFVVASKHFDRCLSSGFPSYLKYCF